MSKLLPTKLQVQFDVIWKVIFDFDNFISYENEVMAKLLSNF